MADFETYISPLLLTNQSLFDTQLTLAIACGRSKSVLRKRHRVHVCTLAEILQFEANRRDQPSPQWPYKA